MLAQTMACDFEWSLRDLCAVCGTVGGFVQVTDNGDGTCSAFTSAAGVFNPIPNCASLAYPSQGICNSLRSDLKITIRRASGAPYVQPDINKWLTQMGLNNVSLSQGSLTVELDHSPYPIPPTLAPSFLPFIRQVCHHPGSLPLALFCILLASRLDML